MRGDGRPVAGSGGSPVPEVTRRVATGRLRRLLGFTVTFRHPVGVVNPNVVFMRPRWEPRSVSSPSYWWYGVALFPVVVLTSILTPFATQQFVTASTAAGEPKVAAAFASFALSILASWLGIVVAVIVLVCLVADVWALRRRAAWSPSWAWGLAGVAHLTGSLFSPLLLGSVPALSYYIYRRRDRVSVPDR